MSRSDPNQTTIPITQGQIWRSPKTWWRVVATGGGSVLVEGPRGSVRTSRDGGLTWSGLMTTMTLEGFRAWVRKAGATQQ